MSTDGKQRDVKNVFQISRTRLWAVVLIATVIAGGCTDEQERVPNEVARLKGAYVPGHNRIYWLDEYRVLFEGHGGNGPSTQAEREQGTRGNYIWDTRAQNGLSRFGKCDHDPAPIHRGSDARQKEVVLEFMWLCSQPEAAASRDSIARQFDALL